MLIKELFAEALEKELIDLQALIMFLVFEMKVITMESSAEELDLYFLKKHNDRMNDLLREYKNKMNMKYSNPLYRVTTKKGEKLTRATSKTDALFKVNGSEAEMIVDDYIYIGNEKYKTKNLLEEMK